MKSKSAKNLKRALVGTIVVAICCFTPILVIIFVGIGLGAIIPYLDFILFPALSALIIATFITYNKWKKSKNMSNQTGILTCPHCRHKQPLEIPQTSCLPYYVCDNCKETIKARGDDCCVFCSHGDKACPVGHKQ